MGTVNAINPSIDRTVQIYDNFYKYKQAVPADQYDAVYSYLRAVFNTEQQAGLFTSTLFRIADVSGIPSMDLLNQLQGLSQPQITLVYSFYLNTFQSPTTMLGVKLPVVPNYYVAHNIKQ